MLEGIRVNEIIAGAYSEDGGICPMLAAHRAGGRTNMISFARAWDRYAFRGARRRTARRATERELLVLRTHLEASLLEDAGPSPELAAAVAEHRELLRQRRAQPQSRPKEQARTDRDRGPELRDRGGWAWLRLFRRYDDYEAALVRLGEAAKRRSHEPVG
jgi:hypothetical protein